MTMMSKMNFLIVLGGFFLSLTALGQDLPYNYKYKKAIVIPIQKVNGADTNIFKNNNDQLTIGCNVKWTNLETNGLVHYLTISVVIFDPAGIDPPTTVTRVESVLPNTSLNILVYANKLSVGGVNRYGNLCHVKLSSFPFPTTESFGGVAPDFIRQTPPPPPGGGDQPDEEVGEEGGGGSDGDSGSDPDSEGAGGL